MSRYVLRSIAWWLYDSTRMIPRDVDHDTWLHEVLPELGEVFDATDWLEKLVWTNFAEHGKEVQRA